MEQKDALNVLLTGRSEREFAQLIKKIIMSKDLEFDMICLKPEVGPNNQQFASKSMSVCVLFKIPHLTRAVRAIRHYGLQAGSALRDHLHVQESRAIATLRRPYQAVCFNS